MQVIPHVTDVIKDRIRKLSDETKYDVVITEIGGTTGDIEGLPFIEAIRQFILEVGPENVVNMHVTLVPYIKAAHELKTKPTQQSVAKLREIGLQPQVLICRSEKPLDRDVRRKLSMFCSVVEKAVIEERDVEHTIYEVPLTLHAEGLDQLVCDLLHLETPKPDLERLEKFRRPRHQSKQTRQDRGGRQIHGRARRLQEHLRVTDPRRRERRLRNRSQTYRC